MEDGAVIERDAVLLGVRDGVGPVFGALGQADEIGHADGRYVGEQSAGQLAGGGLDDGRGLGRCCGRWFGGSGRAAGFFAGAVFAAGVVCDHAAEHAAAISKQIEKQIRMDAPGRRASPGRAGEDTCPYVVCDDCEVRFYPRVWKKLMTGRSRLDFRHRETQGPSTSLGMTDRLRGLGAVAVIGAEVLRLRRLWESVARRPASWIRASRCSVRRPSRGRPTDGVLLRVRSGPGLSGAACSPGPT